MKQVNRIIVRKSVEFYSRAWKNHNEILHDKQRYRQYMIEWYERIKSKIRNRNEPEIKKYLRAQELEVNRCSSYIRTWNMGAIQLIRKVPEKKMQNIRTFFRRRHIS